MTRSRRNIVALATFIILIAAYAFLLHDGWGLYALVTFGYLAIKMLLSLGHRPATGEFSGIIGLVIPIYNEDPDILVRALESIAAQTRRPDRLYVVDDGSTSEAAFRAVALWNFNGHHWDWVTILRSTENRGKRHAQADAFRAFEADAWVTVDSDTVLDPEAIAEIVRPLADPRVWAVTGHVKAANPGKNLLTKLISLRYANAFLGERAAYSVLGSVLCCCGSLSVFRGDLIREELDGYVSQCFLGVPVMYGDDRRLTNLALKRGRVLLQDTAVAHTYVPERFGHFLRQQMRWNRSFFRETLWCLWHVRPLSIVWWLAFAELGIWAGLMVALVFTLISIPVQVSGVVLAGYLAHMALMAYLRSVRYLGQGALRTFLLAPLYGILHVFVLMPLRFISLATLRDRGWSTRSTVEVKAKKH